MVAESSQPAEHKLYLAKKGRLLIDESKRSVALILEDGTQHAVNLREPEKYVLRDVRADDARRSIPRRCFRAKAR